MLNKLQEQAYWAVALVFTASPAPLSHGLNMFGSSLFFGGNFVIFFIWIGWIGLFSLFFGETNHHF